MYTMRGTQLYDSHNRRVAFIRGEEIYDGDNQKIASLRGSFLYDSDDRIMMTIRGDGIFDAKDIRVGSLSDAKRSIEGDGGDNLYVALWYCFIR